MKEFRLELRSCVCVNIVHTEHTNFGYVFRTSMKSNCMKIDTERRDETVNQKQQQNRL